MNTRENPDNAREGTDATHPGATQRIVLRCATCEEGVDVPDKGLGRATAAAWRTRHQGHEVSQVR